MKDGVFLYTLYKFFLDRKDGGDWLFELKCESLVYTRICTLYARDYGYLCRTRETL
jgi:hypothetical protein